MRQDFESLELVGTDSHLSSKPLELTAGPAEEVLTVVREVVGEVAEAVNWILRKSWIRGLCVDPELLHIRFVVQLGSTERVGNPTKCITKMNLETPTCEGIEPTANIGSS